MLRIFFKIFERISVLVVLLWACAHSSELFAEDEYKHTQVHQLRLFTNPNKDFNYDYLIFIPKGTATKSYILVEPKNIRYPTDDMDIHLERALFLTAGRSVGRDVDSNEAARFEYAYRIKSEFGERVMPDRWEFMKKVHTESEVNAELRPYPKMGHRTTTNLCYISVFAVVLDYCENLGVT